MARRGELLMQLPEVVDLAVERGDHGAILVEDRLIAVRAVDDGQPLSAERHAFGLLQTAGIGAAMLHGLAHPDHRLSVHRPGEVDLARYSAHVRAVRLPLRRPPGRRARARAGSRTR